MRGAAKPALVVLAAGLARRYGGCKPLAPIGPHGEAVIDLLADDALAAGFGRIVMVLHPETGPAVRYHVQHVWPDWVDVGFATQRVPLGTVHAVLAAREALAEDEPFGVANADDVYGEPAMRLLAAELASVRDDHVLVAYRLGATVLTNDPVTRGICEVDRDGHLVGLAERRRVRRREGGRLVAGDGLEPSSLAPDLPTSVNLWGFRPSAWRAFDAAMAASGTDEEKALAELAAGAPSPSAEVLLPETVAAMVRSGGPPVRVVTTDTQLIGVTHAADLPVVSAELARQVARGDRPARLWAG